MFGRVLVANRGEIAVRVIRACREMGIEPIAIYSDADQQALHTSVAARAVRVGGAPAAESYLSIESVLAAARETGAEAVHPGYGFLSENPQFATACAAAGIVFIGPSPAAMTLVGSKINARALAERAGVPVIPGEALADQGDAALAAAAARIGFPVLLKPSAGGGGIGMKVVAEPAGLADAAAQARREAAGVVWRPDALSRAPDPAAAPRGVPDHGGPPRGRRPPVRAGMLAAAPASEGDRRVALGGGDAGPSAADGGRGGARREGRRLHRGWARWSSWSRARATMRGSTSWR